MIGLLCLPVGSGGALGFGVWQATHLRSEDLFWIKHTLHSQEPAGFRNLAIKGSTERTHKKKVNINSKYKRKLFHRQHRMTYFK